MWRLSCESEEVERTEASDEDLDERMVLHGGGEVGLGYGSYLAGR